MSAENNIYRFDYGELNDVTPPATPVHRPASGRESALTTLGTGIRNTYTTDPTSGRNKWYGTVLRVEPSAETSGSSESGYSSGWEGTQNRFQDANLVRIKVRIPEAMPALPEPGNLAASPDDMTMDDNIKVDNHPTFVAESPGLPIPNVGDIVEVKYNRQSGQAIYLARTGGTGVAATSVVSSGAGSAFSDSAGNTLESYNTIAALGEGGGVLPPEQNSDAEVLTLPGGAKVWPWRESMRNRSLTLILFYHGVRTGDPSGGATYTSTGTQPHYQSWMFENEEYGIPASMNEITKPVNNAIFVVPWGHGAPWSAVKSDIQTLETSYGITFTSKVMGGWSGGAQGGKHALRQTDYTWDAVYWADPSMNELNSAFNSATSHQNFSNNHLYFKFGNWPSDGYAAGWDDLATTTGATIVERGGTYVQPDASHNQIVNDVIKIIGQGIS